MRAKCLHGYFKFTETTVGQISDYMNLTGLSLVPKKDYYTFEFLEDAPEYSIAGKMILGFPAVRTFEGAPWEVFEANRLVYNFNLDMLQPILSVAQNVTISRGVNRYVANGLILPGSVTPDGEKVTGYDAWFSRQRNSWLYSEVSFV